MIEDDNKQDINLEYMQALEELFQECKDVMKKTNLDDCTCGLYKTLKGASND